jgi:hypothetical protein
MDFGLFDYRRTQIKIINKVGSKYLRCTPMVSSLVLVPKTFNSNFSKIKILN